MYFIYSSHYLLVCLPLEYKLHEAARCEPGSLTFSGLGFYAPKNRCILIIQSDYSVMRSAQAEMKGRSWSMFNGRRKGNEKVKKELFLYTGIPYFLKIHFMPLLCHFMPALTKDLPVFINQKRPEEDLCFCKKRWEVKIANSLHLHLTRRRRVLSSEGSTNSRLPQERHSASQHQASVALICESVGICALFWFILCTVSKTCPKVTASSLDVI